MTEIPKRTIDELLARYELAPDLHDVYVEGEFDKRILEWFLSRIEANDVKVYEIDTVDIPEDMFVQERGATGNRGRIIALCNELENKFENNLNVIGIIDLDFDRVLNRGINVNYVLLTDYSSMEIYLFKINVIQKFFIMVVGRNRNITNRFFQEAIPILQNLYLVRLVKEALMPSMTWIDPSRCFREIGRELQFDWEEYVRRLLNSNGWPVTEDEFIENISHYRGLLPANPIHSIHGHDLNLVIKIWINKVLRISPQLRDREILGGLTASVELENLIDEPMFQAIVQTCSDGAA